MTSSVNAEPSPVISGKRQISIRNRGRNEKKKHYQYLYWVHYWLPLAGAGSSSSSNGTSTNNLSLNTAPTAKLASSQTNANTLGAEVEKDGPRLVAVTTMQRFPLALSTLPAGTTSGTLDCQGLTSNGLTGISGSISYAAHIGSVPAAGDSGSLTFNNCMFGYSGVTFSLAGATTVTYTRYSSNTDYALQFSYSNFSLSASGGTNPYQYGLLTGSITLDVSNGVSSYPSNLADGSATNIAGVSYNGTDVTISNATYVYNSPSAGGIIKLEFNNWTYDTSTGKPVSGSITVTGVNGDTVSIVTNGSSYTVTYTIGGVSTSYMVNY
jgi:hypothetical protein